MDDFLDRVKKEISSTIAVDFDGVIHRNSKGYHDGTIYDLPVKGTEESLKILSEKYTLIIYTCKANPERPLTNGKTGTELIWDWLDKHNLKQYISDITYKKPRAAAYIEDKAIRFESWGEALEDVDTFCTNITEDISKF